MHKNPFSKIITTYVLGFIASIILTLLAFWFAGGTKISGNILITILAVLAVTQLYIQVRYFLHINEDSKAKWNLKAFLFMILVVLILVIGSLWIMYNLTYNMMPNDVDNYLLQEEGFKQ